LYFVHLALFLFNSILLSFFHFEKTRKSEDILVRVPWHFIVCLWFALFTQSEVPLHQMTALLHNVQLCFYNCSQANRSANCLYPYL